MKGDNIQDGGKAYPKSKELVETIGRDTLSEIITLYNAHIGHIGRMQKDNYYNFPRKELLKIRSILDKLKKEGWLSEMGLHDAENSIQGCILRTEKGHRYLSNKMLRNIFKTGGREKQNPPLYILIMILVDMLIAKTKKKHFAWVSEFLHVNNIADKSENEINKLYREGIKDAEKLNEINHFVKLINSIEREMTEEELLNKVVQNTKEICDTFNMSPEDALDFLERYVEATKL